MAAMGAGRARVKGYRTRRPRRAVLLAVILCTAAGLVWSGVLHQTEQGCPSLTSSQRLPADGLDAVSPAPPQFTRVQVLNANGVGGEATIVDGALAQLGFAPSTTPANDPRYPALNLNCYGEIRFGAAGQSAARTLSLVVPCAELVRDVRPDAGIDLALGTKFLALRPNDAARAALLGLAGLGQSAPVGPSHGSLAAQPGPQEMTPQWMTQEMTESVPPVHPDLLLRARQVKC